MRLYNQHERVKKLLKRYKKKRNEQQLVKRPQFWLSQVEVDKVAAMAGAYGITHSDIFRIAVNHLSQYLSK
ncbi:hypothetical protein [Adhaeribacter soli]|uniref:Uncharacterized protein n=1 Tax=Adhaeribacter soli TaxID=2607655 RepID=A0A5N1IZQ0_9BACT|nr:hypothetical protein [Adhaeribacter soli]KAA9338946.1 hypothetical protein F0P94_09150 [Adhaeribacter soli]